MPLNHRGIRCGNSSVPDPPDILESAENGSKFRRLLRVSVYGSRGVTQVDLLSPTIFIVVVDAVLHNWVRMMLKSMEEWSGHG